MFVWTLFKSKIVRTGLYIALSVVVGMLIHSRFAEPKVVERVIENTRIVNIEVPVLTEKTVIKYLTDPKDRAIIVGLLAQNKKLGVEVASLSQTIAELSQHGGTDTGGVVTPPTVETPSYAYNDFQLDAAYQGDYFRYSLHQKFEVLSTTGRDKHGDPVGLTALYQVRPDGERIPVPAKTTVLFADQSVPRWLVSGRVQAGFGVNFPTEKGGIVVFQWLKRGRSPAAEDVLFAGLSPALFVGVHKDVGILPVSVNLGRLPQQPFRDLWVSPFLSRTRAGAFLTATF